MKKIMTIIFAILSVNSFAIIESSNDCNSQAHYKISQWGKALARLDRKVQSLQTLYREGQESFIKNELYATKSLAIKIENSVNKSHKFCYTLEYKKPVLIEKLQIHVDKIVELEAEINQKLCLPDNAMEHELISKASIESSQGRSEKAFLILSKARKLASFRMDNKACFGERRDKVESILLDINKKLDQLVAGL